MQNPATVRVGKIDNEPPSSTSPTPVFLPGESQGRGEPGGLPPMGSHRVGHD